MRKRLLLTADKRGGSQVLYKEAIGHKLFLKKIVPYEDGSKKYPTVFFKKIRLYDQITKTYIKQTVMLRVVAQYKKFIQVEVF